jgi:two-component system LytT family response regulator
MEKIKAVIVDDERLARRRIRRMLAAHSSFEVAGECAGGREAVEFLEHNNVDVLFLDVQMPEMDGFGVIENIGPERVPVVVFVTAYDEHALRAFEVHALDYLMKPFDQARFSRTVERVKAQLEHVRNGRDDQKLAALLREMRGRGSSQHARFAIKTPGRVFFVRPDEIDWIEAADNYVCLHVGADTHLLRETMNSIEGRLDPERFARIHRSTIVNLDRIKELRPWFHGEYVVVLRDGSELTLSRSYRDKVLGVLKAS